jgi:hypothetical protein
MLFESTSTIVAALTTASLSSWSSRGPQITVTSGWTKLPLAGMWTFWSEVNGPLGPPRRLVPSSRSASLVFPRARRHKTNMLAMDRAAHHEHDLCEAAAYFADFFASGALAS